MYVDLSNLGKVGLDDTKEGNIEDMDWLNDLLVDTLDDRSNMGRLMSNALSL